MLSSASSTREATGHCPTCRDVIRRQEVTFLGDAEDAGTHTGEDSTAKECDKKRSPTKFSTALPSFNMETAEVHAAAVGATTARVGTAYMNEQDLARKIREEAAALSTLDESFVSNHTRAERMVGTKMSQLLQEIDAMMKKDAKSKCVVFSQFQDVLDIAKEELLGRGIHFVRIYGNCKQHERADALLEFSSNPDVRVFLLSMRVGSTGLTLTSADHCFILDIAQNTAIEEQAIDRIHRIGQCRPVLVKRFVIEDTVEERLLNIRRALLADRPSGSSGISETSLLDNEEATYLRKHKVNKKERDEAADKQRLDMLENLLGQGDVNKA